MRLTEALIDRLRSRDTPGKTTAEGTSIPTTPPDPQASTRHLAWSLEHEAPRDAGEPKRNGFVHHEPARAYTAAAFPSSLLSRISTEPLVLPWSSRIDEAAPAAMSEVDGAMLAFQETMRAFLETQQEVLAAYLDASAARALHANDLDLGLVMAPDLSDHEPGPWVGEVRRLVAGSEIETVYWIDSQGDPIAENHTLGGRRVSALDPTLKGLPVLPFAVMAEMTAQTAALVVSPGLVLTRLEQVRRTSGCGTKRHPFAWNSAVIVSSRSDDERVWVGIFNRGTDGRAEAARPVFEAVVVFDETSPAPPPATPWALENPRTSRFTAESLYGEQWLFHGPAFQALVRGGPAFQPRDRRRVASAAVGATAQARPAPAAAHGRDRHRQLHAPARLLGPRRAGEGGDVVFPLGMEELELYGDRPPVGTDVACRIAIRELQRHRVRVEAEIVRPDGTVWMRIRDWEDWRFHWPGRYRDVFRQPQHILLGEELPLADPSSERIPRARPCGWNRLPTWDVPSGATSWSRPSSAHRSAPPTWLAAVPSADDRTGSGAGSPPRRPRGGSGRPKAGRRSIRLTSQSSPTNRAVPG